MAIINGQVISIAPEAENIPVTATPTDDMEMWIDPSIDSADGTQFADVDHNHDEAYDVKGAAATVQGNLDTHTGNKSNPHGVTAEQVGAAKTSTYTATFAANGWSAEAPFTQTVSVEGILSTDNPFVDIILSGVETEEESAAIMESWCMVGRITTENGSVTATCFSEVPTVNISIQLKVVR